MDHHYDKETMRAFLKAAISGKKVSDGNSMHSCYRRAYDQLYEDFKVGE